MPNKNTAVRVNRLRIAGLVLLLAGLVLSGYLLSRSLALIEGASGDDVCSIVFGKGCDSTLTDPLSKQLGVPLAGWGVIYFGSLLLFFLLGRFLDDGARAVAASLASLIVICGGLASFALLGALLFGEVPLCPLCLVVNTINLAAIWPVLAWRERGGVAALRAANRSSLALLLLVPLVAGAVYFQLRADTARRERDPDVVAILADFRAKPVTPLAIDPDDAVLGPKSAPVEIVIFSDAFCPHCRKFWDAFMEIIKPHGDDVRLIYKHYPLDATCNPRLKETMHEHACLAGLALEAARLQGGFWKYEEALRAPAKAGESKTFGSVATAVGLDLDRFSKDLRSEATKKHMSRNIRQGIDLALSATPAVFVNGRRVRPLNPRAVEVILADAVRR